MRSVDATIIVVDDEVGTRATLCGILEDAGYRVIGLDKGTDALEMIRGDPFDAIITDIRLPDVSGMEILELAKEINPDAAVIMITGYASIETAVDAVNQGAYAYFVKPINPDELKTTIANAFKQQILSLENKKLVENLQRTNKLLLEANEGLWNEISQRKQVEELYSTLAKSSPVGIYIFQDGKFRFVNPQFQKYTGYSEDELLDMERAELVHPEDRKKARENVVKMLKGNRLSPYEFRIIHRSGAIHWAMETVSSIYYKGKRATLANFMDITESKQAEEALRFSDSALKSIHESVIAMDNEFTITRWNDISEQMYGIKASEAIGKYIGDVIQLVEDYPGQNQERIELLITRGYNREEQVYRTPKGDVWVDVHAQAIEDNGKRYGWVTLAADITERKQMEKELQERNERLDAQNEELQSQATELIAQRQELIKKTGEVERANQLKSEFLANMSHELRTPLNVIIGFSELMVDEVSGNINEEQRKCLNDILTSSQHLLNLINGVLDLSRIESGKIELRLENVALTKVIKSLTRTVMPILTSRKQSLDVEIEKGLPLVYADEGKLAQVVLNLVENASKFSPDGSELKVKAINKGDWCQVSVIDNGVGIKKEDQERIFEPFSRLDYPLVKERGGTGLGLALVKQIVERYGGLISVDSKFGKGSRFIFTVPLATSSKPNPKDNIKQ